jgi:predicted transcriptional regulator
MITTLAQAGRELRSARKAEQNAYEAARLAAVAAWEAGATEVEIARTLGVNRMTVRKWRGKR